MQELTQFCPVQCRIIDVSPIGILGLCNAKGCRCCLVLDSAATDQSCSEWAPAGLPLILPTLIGGDGEGVDALLGNSQFFTQWPRWRLSLSLVRNSLDPSLTPYRPPKGARGQSACRVWWTASGLVAGSRHQPRQAQPLPFPAPFPQISQSVPADRASCGILVGYC